MSRPTDNDTSYDSNDSIWLQIVRNATAPSRELVSEKELSAYSRFTRNNYGVCSITHSWPWAVGRAQRPQARRIK